MTTVHIILLVIAITIVGGLAFYAGKLLAKVREQETKQQQAIATQQSKIAEHNKKLINSIRLIAKAVGEKQCESSEGAIRICRLLEKVYVSVDANFITQYPALHELDTFLSDYPTHQAYKELPRKERMRFDVKRAQEEERLKEAIIQECTTLMSFDVPT